VLGTANTPLSRIEALLIESWVELAATCSSGDAIQCKRSGPTAYPVGGPNGPSASRARSVQGPWTPRIREATPIGATSQRIARSPSFSQCIVGVPTHDSVGRALYVKTRQRMQRDPERAHPSQLVGIQNRRTTTCSVRHERMIG